MKRAVNIITIHVWKIVFLFILMLNQDIFADDQSNFEWKGGQMLPGVGGSVYATTKWDTDAEGLNTEMLIMGGIFNIAGNVTANNIVAWDGNNWQNFGTGLNRPVRALTVYKGNLIAAGDFTEAGGVATYHIARWDGNAWHPLDNGIDGYGYVYALTVYNGELIAAAGPPQIGRTNTFCIARWNGSHWQTLGSGIATGGIYALTVYNEELIAGGNFTTIDGKNISNIARWNGSIWQSVGDGITAQYNYLIAVGTLITNNGCLIAGGNFKKAGAVDVNNIACWNGSLWQPMGNGFKEYVSALTVCDGKLKAASPVILDPSINSYYVASWDGINWSPIGSEITDQISDLTVFDNQLIIAGSFSVAGGVSAYGIAKYTGTNWEPLSQGNILNGNIRALNVFEDQLIAGGSFTKAGEVITKYIACWKNRNWQPLGSGMNSQVNALAIYNGELIAGGSFTKAENTDVNYIAQWNRSSWQPFNGGLKNDVYAITICDEKLSVGTKFTPGDADVNFLAQWNGKSWLMLGTDLDFGAEYDCAITALANYNDKLIGGSCPISVRGGGRGGSSSVYYSHIVSWDGHDLESLTSIENGGISTFIIYKGELIVGGGFNKLGDISANSVGRWNGSNWQPLGSGINGKVSALAIYKGELIAGGYFTAAGGVPANKIARWDGSTWRPLGSGIGPDWPGVLALAVYNGELIVGGQFTTAGGKVSVNFARWGPVNQRPFSCIVGGDKILEAQGPFGATVTLDGSCSNDADSSLATNDDINEFNWYRYTPEDSNISFLGSGQIFDCNLPLGENKILLEVIDKAGEMDSNEITITVQDTMPPDLKVSVTPAVLWPANNKMIKVTPIFSGSDICDLSPEISLINVTMNQGSQSDVQIRDGAIYLRAQRSGNSKGRVYTLTYKSCDDSGNCTIKSTVVTVPHDNRH